MKGNVIRLNIMHLNSVHLNSIGEVQSVSLKAGESTEDPVYPPTTYTLAANVSNGKVTATKNGTAISLPYVATEGDVIVLSVTPDEGYEFNGWLDGNKSNPRTVTMTGNVVLSASCVEIAKPTYTLSASVTNGKVSATLNGSAVTLPFTANEGDTIVVEVTPNDGYTFEGWADGVTDNPRSITMTADVVLSAQCVEVVQPPVGKYIQFEDKNVEAICVANWSSDGIGLTEEDAAKVTSIAGKFGGNTEIVSFEELQYFTGLTSIGSGYNNTQGFQGCTSLQYVTLPTSVTEIKGYAFGGTSSLVEIKGADNVAILGGNVFVDSGIQKLKLPSVQVINASFKACANLQLLECGEKLTSIASYTFWQMTTGLTIFVCRATTPPTLNGNNNLSFFSGIYVPDASLEAYKTAVNWSAYADRIHPLSEIEGSPYITFADAEVERVLMANGVSSDGIGITKEDAAAVTSIGTWFKGNTAMTSFNELQHFTGVTELTANAMQNCSALLSANLDNIQYLRGSSLNNTGLDKVYLPSVKTIAGSALSSGKYSVILLGKNLTNIENYAIRINSVLHTAICLATTPPSCATGNFTSVNALTSVYVPDASVETYKTASGWSGVASKFKGISQLATDNPTLYAEIQQYL